MGPVRDFDEQERKILHEIVRDPRLSDNQIGKNTGIPVKTVNRKRKSLESENILYYMALINHGERGTNKFRSQYLFMVKLKFGITTLLVNEKFPNIMNHPVLIKHSLFSSIGDDDGHVVLLFMLESVKQSDMVEIFNAEIVPLLTGLFGHDCISKVTSFPMRRNVKLLHNYMPGYNMESGKVRKDWPSHLLFID